MLSVEEAKARILQDTPPLDPENVSIRDARGRTLAEDIRAGSELPPFDNSAMDGYAVRSVDTFDATDDAPVSLDLIGEVPAGGVFDGTVSYGKAVRIFTGAPIPPGADTVVKQEDTSSDGETVTFYRSHPAGKNIRLAGEDVEKRERIAEAGSVIDFGTLGLLAALGHAEVPVIRAPRVALVATGDELIPVEETPKPGQIRESNNLALSALVERCGGIPVDLGIAGDDPDALKVAFSKGLEEADILVTIGGVSVGDHDHTRDVLADLGCDMDFWKVRMKPGKPLAYGYHGTKPVFGLPGNPSSAMVTFLLFVAPAMGRLLGRKPFEYLLPARARLLEDVRQRPGRRQYIRAICRFEDGRLVAEPLGQQSSGALLPMARANALAVIPEKEKEVPAGTHVIVHLFDPPKAEA